MLIRGNYPINTYTGKIAVNRVARKLRHQKSFNRLSSIGTLLLPFVKKPFGVKQAINTYTPASQSQILKKAAGFMLFFVLITSFAPNIAFSENDFGMEQTSYQAVGSTIIADDSGFLVPVNPQTGQSDRSEMSDKISHTVQSGETLSVIASSYGLKTSTLMWENNVGADSTLKVGQQLVIPPVDGVTHQVKSVQTVEKIAALYEVEEASIVKQNGLDGKTISAGDSVFVPGGEQIAPAPVVTTSQYRSDGVVRTTTATRVALEGTDAAPAAGKSIIYPTRGSITQGYYSSHRAIDIGDRSKPPVWAAAGGTVIKASSGTWGGGYGNHVIIDHGDGMQTLYAHLDYLTVSEGQYVAQGEVIGRMGNTGRVYGVTGIHLHFELRIDGVKQVPSYYW
jgi:murein DD-endopeptidase MepM/ murein hydrolase activator NlpD